ncbi:hypothetical protein B0H10DRAFT_2166755 [Mycena sp. CBHHK59/15]|nr:hypothetical protein B0H10DRAFT_2166755 [Mycena sp. CBHHK59/15]
MLAGSNVTLEINYLPCKFAAPARAAAAASTRSAAGAARIPAPHDTSYDGVDVDVRAGRAKRNRFKWVLALMNTMVVVGGMLRGTQHTVCALVAPVFLLLTWFDEWTRADVVRVGSRPEPVLSTFAAAMVVFAALVGWAGIVLNNRGVLAVYTPCLGKINKQRSSDIGTVGRLRIQSALGCCGHFSPSVEATASATCYARSVLPGCKKPYWDFEKHLLGRWYTVAFGLVTVQVSAILVGRLCSNHLMYRFGKGMVPKAYGLSPTSMAVITNS